MDESLHNEEKIISYLDGLMSPAERTEFENQLKQSPELQQQFIDIRVAVEAARQFGTREKVATLHQEMMKELRPQKSSAKIINIRKAVRYTIAVAASILLILVGVQTFNYFQNTPEKIYNEAFVDYSVSSERGAKQSISEIESDYKDGQYQKIIKSESGTSLSQKDSFLVALSLLKTDNTSKAIQWLERIDPGNPYYQDAEFYLSLAYLKNKNYQNSLSLMTKIFNDPNHPYHTNITDALIKKVKKLK